MLSIWLNRAIDRQNAKTLSGFGSPKVNEIREDDRGGTYRAVYTVEIQDRVFVLHVFQKKSTRRRETSQQDMKTIKERLKEVESFLLLKEKE